MPEENKYWRKNHLECPHAGAEAVKHISPHTVTMLGTAAVMVLMLGSGAAAMVITTPHFRCVDISRYIYNTSTIYLQRDLHLQEPGHVCGQSGGEHGDGGHRGGAGGGPPPHHQHPPQGTAHKVGRKIFVTRKNILMKIFLVFGWKAAAAMRCTAGGGGAARRPG